jgi:class 3 adenylate cyclase
MKDQQLQECSKCGTENAPDAKFCQQCGQPLSIICANCSEINDPDARFCKNCGNELSQTSKPDQTASLETLQQSAPDDLQAKVRNAMSQMDDERKPVTILFVDIVGSTSKAEKMDPEEWREVVTGAHRRLSEAIYQYEGTVAQLLGDGLLAFFGAPITHEDDPSRAVHAGLEIQRLIRDYGNELAGYVDDFQVRVGINTGTVVIGDVGEGMNVEYLAVGDAINVASRIESEATPGTVWLGEDCARLISSEFDLKDQGEIEVKGKAVALRLYEVTGTRAEIARARETKGPESVYVGRDQELGKLQSAIVDLCRGHGQIAIIQGEAGIGKSRLVQELRSFTENYDVGLNNDDKNSFLTEPSKLRWLEGRSLSYGASLSFWAITKLLMADMGLNEDVAEARIEISLRKRVKQLFGAEGENFLPYLMHLLGLKLKGEIADHIGSLDGETLRRETLSTIYEYFARLAEEQPTILVFEDTHWADPSTIKALEILLPLADRVPLMILCPMRIERDHPSWNIHLLAETNFAHRYALVTLKKLSNSESTLMMDGLLGVSDLPANIRDFVLKRSEGNPLYVEEVVQHLVEQDYLVMRMEPGG